MARGPRKLTGLRIGSAGDQFNKNEREREIWMSNYVLNWLIRRFADIVLY